MNTLTSAWVAALCIHPGMGASSSRRDDSRLRLACFKRARFLANLFLEQQIEKRKLAFAQSLLNRPPLFGVETFRQDHQLCG